MSLLIRAYQNTDTQALCRVFNSHYQSVGLPGAVVPLSLELCVLAKPYFESSGLLVAEQAGQLVGFTQLGLEPDSTLTSVNSEAGIMSVLCVAPGDNDFAVGQILIEEAVRSLRESGAKRIRFSPPPPATPYFAGISPGAGMIGCPVADPRTHGWLEASGWTLEQSVVSWELDLNRFQPPVDRMQIQIRRMAHVDRLVDEPVMPWYVASMLGHTEPIGFQLTDRQSRTVTCEVILWTIGHELLPQPESVAHLWPIAGYKPGQEDQLVFLISEALRQLRDDRVDVVRTAVPAQDTGLSRILSRIGFMETLSGDVMTRAV